MATAAPKRSLFKKPVWAATQSLTQQLDDNTIFGRSTVYEDILEEKRRKKDERAEKAKARAEKDADREPKRRRISDDGEDSTYDHSVASTPKSYGSDDSHKESLGREGPVTRSTPTKKQKLVNGLEESPIKPVTSPRTARTTTVINLEDEDVDEIYSAPQLQNPTPKQHIPATLQSDPESEDDDEYTQELKRKAREKARLRKVGINIANSPDCDVNGIKSPSPPAENFQSTSAQLPAEIPRDSPAEDDPTISILITSLLPDAKKLIVHRRASQSLTDVLEIWCRRQGYTDAEKSKVFLAWRGKKMFATATMKTVLAVLKKERPIGRNGNEDPSDGKVEIEVMNQAILEHRQKQRDRFMGIASDEPETEPEVEEPPPEPRCVIQLKAENMETMQLRVRPATTIDKIMRGFKVAKNVQGDKTCWLIFDGERLDPEATVADLEIEDEDVIEVLIR